MRSPTSAANLGASLFRAKSSQLCPSSVTTSSALIQYSTTVLAVTFRDGGSVGSPPTPSQDSGPLQSDRTRNLFPNPRRWIGTFEIRFLELSRNVAQLVHHNSGLISVVDVAVRRATLTTQTVVELVLSRELAPSWNLRTHARVRPELKTGGRREACR